MSEVANDGSISKEMLDYPGVEQIVIAAKDELVAQQVFACLVQVHVHSSPQYLSWEVETKVYQGSLALEMLHAIVLLEALGN